MVKTNCKNLNACKDLPMNTTLPPLPFLPLSHLLLCHHCRSHKQPVQYMFLVSSPFWCFYYWGTEKAECESACSNSNLTRKESYKERGYVCMYVQVCKKIFNHQCVFVCLNWSRVHSRQVDNSDVQYINPSMKMKVWKHKYISKKIRHISSKTWDINCVHALQQWMWRCYWCECLELLLHVEIKWNLDVLRQK